MTDDNAGMLNDSLSTVQTKIARHVDLGHVLAQDGSATAHLVQLRSQKYCTVVESRQLLPATFTLKLAVEVEVSSTSIRRRFNHLRNEKLKETKSNGVHHPNSDPLRRVFGSQRLGCTTRRFTLDEGRIAVVLRLSRLLLLCPESLLL